MKLQPGATLQNGKYLLSQALGDEGVGATYLATQTLLNQGVVIKTLDPSLQVTRSFPQLKAEFIEEVRLLARTQHPSIVRVLDFFEEDQLPCLVMEFVSGQALATLVSVHGALAEAEAIHYIRQAGSAVSVAHGNGLIHRNIQPRSLIRRQGTNLAILVGFGFAHDLASPSLPPTQINPFTPDWDVESQTAIDRYGLAVTLYYLLSGQAPTAQMSLDQHSWSDTTKEAILQGMNPALRSQSVEEWLRFLPNTTLPLLGVSSPAASAPTSSPRPVSQPIPLPMATPREASPKVVERDVVKQNAPSNAPSVVKAPQTPPPPPPLKITQPAATLNVSPKPTLPPVARPLTQKPIAAYSGMSPHFPKFLVITGATATALGLGFGLALRISAAKAPGASIFHPAQTFSDRAWKGTLSPSVDQGDIPVEKMPGSYGSKPPTTTDWTMPANSAEQGSVDVPATQLAPIQRAPELERSLPSSPQTELAPLDSAPVPVETPRYRPVEPAPVKPIPKAVSPVEPPLPTAPEVPAVAPVSPATNPSNLESRESAPEPPTRSVTGN
ncbi:MAG: protein kinase [Myxacorys californica WJT36-NPBG1]|jgi:serine/threonine-protein kinase|nr:protein kinase [Myxacorys californica WJT36-NPBG1]